MTHNLWLIFHNDSLLVVNLIVKFKKSHRRLLPWPHLHRFMHLFRLAMSLDFLSDFMRIYLAHYFPVALYRHRYIWLFSRISHCQLSRTRLWRPRRDRRRRTSRSIDQSSSKYQSHLWPRDRLSIGDTLFDFKLYFDNLDHRQSFICFFRRTFRISKLLVSEN